MTQAQIDMKEEYNNGLEDALFGQPAADNETSAYYAGYISIDETLLL